MHGVSSIHKHPIPKLPKNIRKPNDKTWLFEISPYILLLLLRLFLSDIKKTKGDRQEKVPKGNKSKTPKNTPEGEAGEGDNGETPEPKAKSKAKGKAQAKAKQAPKWVYVD